MVRNILTSLALAASLAAQAVTTNVIDVAEGETATLSLSGTPANGDWVVKTGKGQLNAVNTYKSIKLNFHIMEGVYFVPNSCGDAVHKGDNAKLIIEDGATVNIEGGRINQFSGWWDITFSGHGTGTGNNLGAICVGGGQTNPTLSTGGRFTMTGDATIYSYGTTNAVLSGTGSSSGPDLVMNGRTLTIRGKASTSVFRPRWKLSVSSPGTIIVQNGQFARHDTTNDFASDIPLIKVVENGKLAAYDNGKIWSKVKAFDFEYGSSLAAGNGSPTTATLTMKKVTGPATVANTVLTISQELVVRGTDLVAEHHLTSANVLTFAEGCKVSIADWGSLSFAPGARHVVAEATSIVGTPTLSGTAADLFTVEKTETQIVLVAKASNRVPALLEGEENAAHNTEVMAAMTLADGDAFCFPGGDYFFSAPIDFSASTAKNVSFSCLEEAPCTLHAGLKLGAMENVSVRNLTFKGFDTPAIIATGTAGLAVEKCTLETVKGTYGENGNFPYALVNVTDFKLTDPTYVADAAEADSTLWDGPAYFDGGSQTADSRARAGEIVAHTIDGIYKDNWWGWYEITNAAHLATDAYNGKVLRKTGPSALDITYDLANLGVKSVEVERGQFVARSDAALGKAKSSVHVCEGAALTIAGTTKGVNERKVTFSGTGVKADTPAIRFTGTADWNKTASVDWTLEGDATMYNNCSGECGTFLWGTMHMAGHTLTLKGIAAANYRFGRSFDWYGGGTMIVNGVALSASSGTATAFAVKDNMGRPTFKFVNGAKFIPDNTDIFNLVKVVDFAAGTQLAPKNATACSFAKLTGPVNASSEKVNGLTITESYTVRTADLLAAEPKTMSVHGALAFSTGAVVEVDNPSALERKTYVIATADSLLGTPKTTGALAEAGFTVSKRGTSLVLGPPQGTMVIVR